MKPSLFRGASPRPPSQEASPRVLRRTSRNPPTHFHLVRRSAHAKAALVTHSPALVRSARLRIVRVCLAVAARLRRQVLATAVLVAICGNSSVLACTLCFGAEETSMIDGAKLGVLVMLGVTFAVQGGFLGFFLYLRKRAKRIADIDVDTEWSKLQRASR